MTSKPLCIDIKYTEMLIYRRNSGLLTGILDEINMDFTSVINTHAKH
jgi:hypothetical protein